MISKQFAYILLVLILVVLFALLVNFAKKIGEKTAGRSVNVENVFGGNGAPNHNIFDTTFDATTLDIAKKYEGSGRDISLMQTKIAKKFKQFKIPRKKLSFVDFCFPKSFKLQPPQSFVSEYFSPLNLGLKTMEKIDAEKTLLIFHKIGAGKTCAAINIAEKWIASGKRSKPMIVTAASLIPGLRNEIRGPCGLEHYEYISEDDREKLAAADPAVGRNVSEYKRIVAATNMVISTRYTICSYNKFLEDFTKNKLVKPSILIVDEVQNINNVKGSYFYAIASFIEKYKDMPVVLMSGTPIFDNPRELIGLMRLLRVPNWQDYAKELPKPQKIAELFAGKISYYPGAPDYTFPRVNLRLLPCRMSAFQSRWYRSQVAAERKKGVIVRHEIPNDFYIKSRQRANIVYPNGLTGAAGLAALTPAKIRENLDVYSVKFAKLLKRLAKGELSFVYTGFAEYGGIAALCKCLDAHGYRNFAKHGPGKNRYAIWSGEETDGQKEIIRATFNSRENDKGNKLRVVVGSPAIKEGVSLFRVRQVHVLEAYWNHSRLAQIYGRAIRYCSHKTLPAREREVDIYIYVAFCYDSPKVDLEDTYSADLKLLADPNESIDSYMLDIANTKKEESEPYIEALQRCAVDKKLYRL